MNEEQVRYLVISAVNLARTTTPGNMCDEAVVERIMHDHYKDGRWRSLLFEEIIADEPREEIDIH